MKQILENTIEEKASSWPSFFKPISEDLVTLEKNLTEELPPKSKLLSTIIKHIFTAGGKRFRPCLCFLIAKGTTGMTSKHITLAELTELIHTASLVHDDIIDSASLRRGKETINNLWNNKVSVISGDFLFAEASIRLGILENSEIVKIYAQVLSDLCDGEIEQYTFKFNPEISWDYYIQKSTTKTASLFAAVCKSSAIVSNLSEEDIQMAHEFGKNLGISFQIIDDILDFTADQSTLGKDVCSDLKQGLITAPTLYALEAGNEKSKELKALIETRFSKEEDFNKAISIIKDLNGCEKAKELAINYTNKAKENLSFITDPEIKQHLENSTEYMLKRLH